MPEKPQPTLPEFFILFCRIGLTSFGGGVSGWLFREIVQKNGWIEDGEFFDAYALCQALPGINVTNMAVWMGYRLLGTAGAVCGVAGLILAPSVIIVLIAAFFSSLSRFPLTHILLTGAAAAAVGIPFSMGLRMAWRSPRALVPMCVVVATFVAVGMLKLPLLWVLPTACVISVLGTQIQMARE